MNKQEFQKTIRNMEPPKHFSALTFKEAFNEGFNSAKNNALFSSCFLNEPEKPVVPQFVADFYEPIKDGIRRAIVLAKQLEEQEKLYTVEIPNPNGFIRLVLCKDCDGKLFVATFSGGDCWENFGKCKITESEIKKDFDWAWQFAKEVEND